MKIKLIDSDDYMLIRKWWEKHEWEPVHPYLLSDTGYLILDEDMNITQIMKGWNEQTIKQLIEDVLIN